MRLGIFQFQASSATRGFKIVVLSSGGSLLRIEGIFATRVGVKIDVVFGREPNGFP